MKKKIIIATMLSVFSLYFVGCKDENHIKVDVDSYLKENGFASCQVEGDCQVADGKKQYWDVYDEENGVHFNVINVTDESGWMGSQEMYDNYDAKLVEEHVKDLPEHEGVEIVTGDMWSENASLEFEYTNLDELEEKYNIVKSCAKYLDDLSSDVEIRVSANLAGPRVDYYKDKTIDGILKYTDVAPLSNYSAIKSGETLDYIKKQYFQLGYTYRFPEIEEEMKSSDIETFFEDKYTNCAAVYHSGDPADETNEDYAVYDDIYTDGTLTFGNLYYLLIDEGFDVEGSVDNFTVQGVDGQMCQFSYGYAGSGEHGTYYLVDDEEISCDCNYFKLYKKTIYDLFGLTVEEYNE